VNETVLASFAQELLNAPAEPDAPASREAERIFAAALSRFLGVLLKAEPRWDSRYRWIDDMLVHDCCAVPKGRIDIAGSVVGGERGTSGQWLEPCRAGVKVSEGALDAYEIRFADADRRERLRYEGKNAFPALEPTWLFRFVKNVERLEVCWYQSDT
jgi:hypothetical protein